MTRPALALGALLLLAACSMGTPATPDATGGAPSPIGSPAPGRSPSPATPADPTLDPGLSDAGVVGLAVLPNDTRGGRTGAHLIVGQRAAGSDCSTSFDGTEFTAVAWIDGAPDGALARLSATVPADDVPDGDGLSAGIDGRISFDFVSESGFGTLYTGDSSGDNEGHSTIDVTRVGELLSFTFSGTTWDDVDFSGQLACTLE